MRHPPRAFALLSVIAILGAAAFLAGKASLRATDALGFAKARLAAGQARSAAQQEALLKAAHGVFLPTELAAQTYPSAGLIDINQSDPLLLAKALVQAGESAAQAQTYSSQIQRGRPWTSVEAMFAQLRIGQGGLARYWMTVHGQAIPQANLAPGQVASLLGASSPALPAENAAISLETLAFAEGIGAQGGRAIVVVRLEYADANKLAAITQRQLTSDQFAAANQRAVVAPIRRRP